MLKDKRMFRTTRRVHGSQNIMMLLGGKSLPSRAMFSLQGKWSCPLIQLDLFPQNSSQGIIFMSTEVNYQLICDIKIKQSESKCEAMLLTLTASVNSPSQLNGDGWYSENLSKCVRYL